MLDEMMVRYCAPTLAGIKTGNLMNCPCTDREFFRNSEKNESKTGNTWNLRDAFHYVSGQDFDLYFPSGEFPHEVGLFLGYPPEDVRGFIENHAKFCNKM